MCFNSYFIDDRVFFRVFTIYIVFDDFVSELINKRTSRKHDFSIIAESKPFADQRTHLHAMKGYNTRQVSLTIEVFH